MRRFVSLLAAGSLPFGAPPNSAEARVPARTATQFDTIAFAPENPPHLIFCPFLENFGPNAAAMVAIWWKTPSGRTLYDVKAIGLSGGSIATTARAGGTSVSVDSPPYGRGGFMFDPFSGPMVYPIEAGSTVVLAVAAWDARLVCQPFAREVSVVHQPLAKARNAFPSDFSGGPLATATAYEAGATAAAHLELTQSASGLLLAMLSGSSSGIGVSSVQADGPEGQHVGRDLGPPEVRVGTVTSGDWHWRIPAAVAASSGAVLWTMELPVP